MKPAQESKVEDEPKTVTGDVIGNTAYSERFVLKILLKFANLDTLKEEVDDKSFEDDLCMLWDMTAERDVVLFLHKHQVLTLFNFALPAIKSLRVVEIIIGIIGNMCCQKEVVTDLLKMDEFVKVLLSFMSTDDCMVLTQLLRLINSSLFLANENDIAVWLNLFKANKYSRALYFILKNSSNKQLLITALENFNTICSYCNTEKFRKEFYLHFVLSEAINAVITAFSEIMVKECEQEELERLMVISFQIILNIVGFDKPFSDNIENLTKLINIVLDYYENKLIEQKEIDKDLIDIVDSTIMIVNMLNIHEKYGPEVYFKSAYNIWKELQKILLAEEEGENKVEKEDKDEIREFSDKIRTPLCTLMCSYMQKCSESNLNQVLDDVGSHYEDILKSIEDTEKHDQVTKRAENYRTRLKENVDS